MDRAIEGFRPSHGPEGLMQARIKTWRAVQAIAAKIRPGMTEAEATRQAQAILSDLGAEKHWHRPLIRFGESTLKAFSAPADPEMRLEDRSIFFVDIGPVFEGYEGDAGATFVSGAEPDEEMQKCAEDVHILFNTVAKHWRETQATGVALYTFAAAEAKRMGWELNQGVDGHRVSDFPHQMFFRGGMGEVDFTPIAGAWILEIQIRHPTKPYGAFYEDLLV